jgi:hypothetical protein
MSLMLTFMTVCTFTGNTEAIFGATPNTTVSDSERIWWTEDGVLKPDYKVVAFAAYDRLNLEQDLARGQGEYLASLGSMLGVQEDFRPAFEAAAQQHFEAMVPRDRMLQVQQLRALVE